MLTNEHLQLTLEPHTGSLCSLYDKRYATQYIGQPRFARLFRLIMPLPDWRAHPIDSWQQPAPQITQHGQHLIVTYSSLTSARGTFPIQVTVEFSLDAEEIPAQIHIVNHSPHPITDVMFPWLAGLTRITDSAQDCLIVPAMAGEKVIRDPLGAMPSNFFSWNRQFLKKRYTYPSSLATAWCDFSGGTHGLSLDVRDQSFAVQDLYIEKLVERHPEDKTLNTEALSFAWTFYPHIAPGETWTSPPVRIGLHAGDWHTVADRHRTWLEGWITRPDVPDRFRESIGWHFYFMMHEDGTVLRTYDDLPHMAQVALDCGIEDLLIFGWFEGGHDNLFPHFEAVQAWGGATALKEKMDALKAMGVNPILYVNPTIWDLRTDTCTRHGAQWSVKSRLGAEFRERWAWENFDATAEHRLKGFVRICPSNGSTPFFLEVLKRILNQYGAPSIHLDQIGDRAFCCYDPTHDHEKPQYASCQGYRQLLDALRPLIQQQNGVLLIQGASDFHNQWADASWEVEAPFLFANVHILRYSLPWVLVSHEIEANEYADVNACFAANVLLDIKIDSSDGSLAEFPVFGAHIKRVAALKKRVAPYHAHAVFRDTIGLTCNDQDNAVLARLHRAPNKAGIVIANLTAQARTVALGCDWQAIGLTPQTGRWTSSRSSDWTGLPIDRLTGPDPESISIALAAYEVGVACIDGADL